MQRAVKVAIVGRPNVGKSALFNRICKKRISIVDEEEGVTRDRIYGKVTLFGKSCIVIDTGGIQTGSSQGQMQKEIRKQSEMAIAEADRIIFVVDGLAGVTAMDDEIAKMVLKSKKPITLAINKIDRQSQEIRVGQFYSLGIADVVAVSAAHDWQITELLERALESIPEDVPLEEKASSADNRIKIAIVGRPNGGKSTLLNHLMQQERSMVSPEAGTTRDSIDSDLEHEGVTYTFIDTAGIRRKRAEHSVIEKFAAIRTQEAISRADICLLVLDSREGITAQEKRIASMIEEEGKGCILLFNKWDLVKGFRMEHCLAAVREENHFLTHCPAFFISAATGRNVFKLFPAIQEVAASARQKVTTGQLNRFLERAMQEVHPAMIKGKRLRIYYMVQTAVSPQTFLLFVNNPDLMSENYRKYLIFKFREAYGFKGVPLIFSLRGKQKISAAERIAISATDELSTEEEGDDASLENDEEFSEEEVSLQTTDTLLE